MVPLVFVILHTKKSICSYSADAVSLVVKLSWLEADNWASIAEVKNTWGYTSTYCVRLWFSEGHIYLTATYVLRPLFKSKCI